MSTPRIPPAVFGVAFGLAGLATTWRIASAFTLAPVAVSNALVVVSTLVWAITVILYARYAVATRGTLSGDLADRTVGPFLSLALLTPLLLAADGLTQISRPLGTVVVDVLVGLVLLLGGGLTGLWMRGGTDIDRLHPGYFLPTVAGGLVCSVAAADVGQYRLAEVMLGVGLICWLILGSMIMTRLMFRPPLPDALVPTMAIEVAPASVASIAYLGLNGGHLDVFAAVLAGYGLLMVTAQISLLPRYLRLTFSLGTWAFTFSWTAVASTAVYWLALAPAPGGHAYSYLILAAISALVTAIAARTVLALSRGQLLPGGPTHRGTTPVTKRPDPRPSFSR
jgi:tellurite resistance protein